LAVLEVRDLHVSFRAERGTIRAVRGVSFAVRLGEMLAIVGESGSGKSTCALSILGLNRQAETSGEVLFDGSDLLKSDSRRLREVRGNRISIVLQDPLSGLHPYYKVGWQIVEAIRAHRPNVSKRSARSAALEVLDRVGLAEPGRAAESYPFQLSGGMRQRSMIAMAIALDPELLIADEPTTALDAAVKSEILELIRGLQKELGIAVILVTHDLGVVSHIADDVVVMYAGSVVERASRKRLFASPIHPYTNGLLQSSLEGGARSRPLSSIPGNPPDPLAFPRGCAFHPRCSLSIEKCTVESPELKPVQGTSGHECACWVEVDDHKPDRNTEETIV